MSERTEIEVLVPVERPPTRFELRTLLRMAFRQANMLAAPGRVLGLSSIIRAKTLDGDLAVKFRFAVTAPESVQRVNGVRV